MSSRQIVGLPNVQLATYQLANCLLAKCTGAKTDLSPVCLFPHLINLISEL